MGVTELLKKHRRIALDTKVSLAEVKAIVLQNGVKLNDDCINEFYRVATGVGALRVMTKMLMFAWSMANNLHHAIGIDDVMKARRVIISRS